MKHFILSLLFGLFFSAVSAQTIVPIENHNTFAVVNCDNTVFTANPYSGATFKSINISLSEFLQYTVILNADYFDQKWDIDDSSELRFYDGFQTTANLLGTYNSTTHPNGFLLDIETNSLRIELQTAAGSTGNGFERSLFCDETLQTLPNVKFKPQLSEKWYFDENQDMYAFRNCLNESINIAIEPIYLNPELENQNVDSVLIKWALGNGSFKREKGLTSINHVYTNGSGYLVTVYSQDSLGIESHLKFMVQNSPPPTYSVNTDQSFCLDDPTEVIGDRKSVV